MRPRPLLADASRAAGTRLIRVDVEREGDSRGARSATIGGDEGLGRLAGAGGRARRAHSGALTTGQIGGPGRCRR
jgi:hypothetical protein